MAYTVGLDYGTNSVRCVIVDITSGEEVGTGVWGYESGQEGILLDSADHNLARQNPADYLKGAEITIREAIKQACTGNKDFKAEDIIAIGVDTTGSTPLPVDKDGVPLCSHEKFKDNLNAYAWLWKDHTAHVEAGEITELADNEHPEYLAKCGGTYSSEWFWSKVLHCLRCDREVFDAAYTWVECADFIPAHLSGNMKPGSYKASRCAAGHKAMYCEEWGGLPAMNFLSRLDPALGKLRERMYDKSYTIAERAGELTKEWAEKLGVRAGIPVAVGAFDAHLGAVGSGIRPGRLVKILGTSTCDILVSPIEQDLPDIPGVCGIVDGSVLPDNYGLEAGQSAVGDIFNWFVNYIQPGGREAGSHEALTEKAAKLKPGQSGLLALDWNNGNRTVLVDQRLTGLLVGQTLHTKPEEIYRALIEATAFGALTIINRFVEYGVVVDEVVTGGGIAEKNSLLMQIYADVTGRELRISRSGQTCALGSAIAAAVAAGIEAGGYDTFAEAQGAMCGMKDVVYKPIAENQKIYAELYKLYLQLHDAFGVEGWSGSAGNVMKELLAIKDRVNG